ncbi:MAG: FAD-dependent oxidoreductase [Cyanobacteria bacterium J06635_15]
MTSPSRVTVIGCGVVGAAIAYELSLIPNLDVAVFDRNLPAQGATGAALGVMMAVISHKTKGRNWYLREISLQRYETLIPELAAATGQTVPYNRHGILSLVFDAEAWPKWQRLQTIRQTQSYPLELWSVAQVRDRFPELNLARVYGAIYSPRDRQVEPTSLNQALVTAAQQQGAQLHLNHAVKAIAQSKQGQHGQAQIIQTDHGDFTADWVVVAAGLGTPTLTSALPMIPVLGQAMKIHCKSLMMPTEFQPVINGDDIHLVPLGNHQYWVGATVEFPPQENFADFAPLVPQDKQLEALLQGAIAYCPALAQGIVNQTWSGLRPRPQGQAAPVIQPLKTNPRMILATGHYRNGVLLAPATALTVKSMITS